MNSTSTPFKLLGSAAIIVAGLIAAAIARNPARPMVWMVAYLVLVVGVVQYALGVGQAALSKTAPGSATVWGQWLLLNMGHAGVIAGTLAGSFRLLVAGTILYDVAVAWLGLTVRGNQPGMRLIGYRVLIVVMLASSAAGLVLSTLGK